MNIRAITLFNGKSDAHTAAGLAQSGGVLRELKRRFSDGGLTVQSTRLALCSKQLGLDDCTAAQAVEKLVALDERSRAAGVDYFCIGPLGCDDALLGQLEWLPEIFARTSTLFASAMLTDASANIREAALLPVGQAIRAIAHSTPDGFQNLRFAALARCGPGIPFFPAAYAVPEQFAFALAIEGADLALAAAALQPFPYPRADFSRALSAAIETEAARIEPLAQAPCGAEFLGCDWSLAPSPGANSIGQAIELLSGAPVGEFGTLAAVSALTRGIREARVKHTGFSGIFLPVLEDNVLAARGGPHLDLQTLLLYCTVCGTGLDTIPLAGNADPAAMGRLIGDVAELAVRLNKPLTVRLMPVPNLRVGEMTRFDSPHLVNGRAFELPRCA